MEILDPAAFKRDPGAGDYEAFKATESSFLNRRNLFFIPKRKIVARFTISNRSFNLAYRFELVRSWIVSEKQNSFVFSWLLRYLLHKLCLDGELNAREQNFLALTDNLIFTRYRSIKDLPVDFVKQPGEIVAFHYDAVTIAQVLDNENRPIVSYGDVYLSNQRLVFSDALQFFALPNRAVADLTLARDALLAKTNQGLEFRIECEAPLVLLTAFKKISG